MMGFIHAQRRPNGTKTRAKTMQLEFHSRDECIGFLMEAHDGKNLFGLPASVLLEGKKHLMWVDIDAPIEMFEAWKVMGLPFPKGSHQHVMSSTGNTHLYVMTERPLEIGECFSMCEWIRNRAPEEIAPHIDRVHGPQNMEPIFFPRLDERTVMPQELVASCDVSFRIPDIEGSIFKEWKKRHG